MSIAEKFEIIADEVYAKGVEVGKSQGGDTEEAYNQGFEAGKQEQYNDFWKNLQDSGNKKNYNLTFGGSYWNDDTFKPQYDIKPTGSYMFFARNDVTDLVQILEDAGVTLDTSNSTTLQYAFQLSKTTRAPKISLKKCPNTNITGLFALCYNLVSVEELIFSDEGTQGDNNMFNACTKLTDLKIGGVIGANFSVKDSPLTIESARSIINALKDYSGTTTTRTLTLSSTTKSLLTETDIATITQKGWTLA